MSTVNQPGSNPIRTGLAHAQAAGPHPDADLLAAFAEGTLLRREQTAITEHLAACAHCREIVSLAAAVAPEPLATPMPEPSHPSPRRWLAWAAAACSAAIAIAVVHARRSQVPSANPHPAVEMARITPPPPMPAPPATPSQPALAESKPRALPVAPPRGRMALRDMENANEETNATADNFITSQNIAAANAAALNSAQQSAKPPDRAPNAAPEAAASAQSAVALGSAKRAPAAETETVTVSQSPAVEVAPLPSTYRGEIQQSQLQAAPPQAGSAPGFIGGTLSSLSDTPVATLSRWRITADGRVERRSGSGPWVLATPPDSAKMRVVAVVGARVWAGGEGLRLYTSADNGVTWRLVPLAAKPAAASEATGNPAVAGRAAIGGLAKDKNVTAAISSPAITHIRFQSGQTGAIEADNGAEWTTTDSGATWK